VGCLGQCSLETTIQEKMPGRQQLINGKITEDKVSELVDKVIVNIGYLDENLLIQSFTKAGVR